MEIRAANIEDIPMMVQLMKSSLGESLVPKSEGFFKWKHLENPFGVSKMMVATEQNRLIGLRAFMHWSWVRSQDSIHAVRAVDTATDPAHQGKGIFRQLTMKAVNDCIHEGVDMVFNSPNPTSLKGYLKMGWYLNGKMPLYVGPGVLLPRWFHEKRMQSLYDQFPAEVHINRLHENWLLTPHATEFHTQISYRYLLWRYAQCPVARYGAVIEPGAFGMIFRLKKFNQFTELRICECWTENDRAAAEAKRQLKEVIAYSKPAMITCAPSPQFGNGEASIGKLMGPFKKGPLVTLRTLALQQLNDFKHFNHWKPSIGSMELF